ncbi:glycosyltransferase [Alteromonas sp. ASW11-130]|uniref:glycosyltransferase n=1 Tax=Alteromonas sp. ASW11-130 TaxID=3015775 RepID=UPI002241B0FF|nr:glycosyltransferase [Alteromonas sp. ASW11-130]MCW8091304.1 glycosyltransferase [Alteromonas sp. ASW11-130]
MVVSDFQKSETQAEISPFVSIVVPAYNEEKYLAQCLTSLTNQTYSKERYEIIVVDNGSTDETVPIAKSFDVNLILQPKGPVGNVRNTGVDNAQGDIIFFIDADCEADEKWLETGVESMLRDPKVYGGGYRLRKNPYFLEKYWLLNTSEGEPLHSELLGGCIVIQKDVFNEVGQFDTTVTSGEDSKITQSLLRAGYEVKMDRKYSVVHLGNPIEAGQFIKRQVWHSENYIKDIRNSIKDPVFLLTLSFASSILLSLMLLPILGFEALYFVGVALLIPLIFSLKRIKRCGEYSKIMKLPFIYYLDLLYLIGRSFGIIKGLSKSH